MGMALTAVFFTLEDYLTVHDLIMQGTQPMQLIQLHKKQLHGTLNGLIALLTTMLPVQRLYGIFLRLFPGQWGLPGRARGALLPGRARSIPPAPTPKNSPKDPRRSYSFQGCPEAS